MKNLVFVSLALVLTLIGAVYSQGVNFQACQTNRDCRSNKCQNGRCAQVTCRNDKACLKAGLFDHYCRRRGPKIFRSECVAKRGHLFILDFLLFDFYIIFIVNFCFYT